MTRDAAGNHHLTGPEAAAALRLWLESRGGTFTLDEDARIVTCNVSGVDLAPLTEADLQHLAVSLFWDLRAILRGEQDVAVH